MYNINKHPFNIFEKMLGEELYEQLRDIVEKECDEPNTISLRGIRMPKARSRTLKSVKPVIIRFNALFGPNNSYEHYCRYIQNNLVLNLERATAL